MSGYCIEGDRCVCGGDTAGVRAGCGNWKEVTSGPKGTSALDRIRALETEVAKMTEYRDEAAHQLVALRMNRPPFPDICELSKLFNRHRSEIDDNCAYRINEWIKAQLADARGEPSRTEPLESLDDGEYERAISSTGSIPPFPEPDENGCWYGVEICTLPHCDCNELSANREQK